MKQFVVTPPMGKRLIGKGMAAHPAIQGVLKKGTLAILAGTTNAYVAEEVLSAVGQAEGFSRDGFRRGTTVAPGFDKSSAAHEFPGDVILVDGVWDKGKQIFDVAGELKCGDVILKGGNALDVRRRRAAVQIGHPEGGTAGVSLPGIFGRRVRLIVPIGLEKRVLDDLDDLAAMLNAPEAAGPRLMPLPGEAFCELDAIALLTGATATLVAAGGVYGAEGATYIAVTGDEGPQAAAEELIKSVAGEPPYSG